MKNLVFLFLLCCSTESIAVEVAGVKLESEIQLYTHKLVLNGTGLRTKFFFKVYVAGLYLDVKVQTGAAVLANSGAKRMLFHLLRNVSGKQMLEAINEIIPANHSDDEMKVLSSRLNTFSKIFESVAEVRKGETVMFDYEPGSGTRVIVGGIDKGIIDGVDFNRALLKVWVGDKPAQDDLKKSLLGGV